MEGLLQEEDDFRGAQGVHKAIVEEVDVVAEVRVVGLDLEVLQDIIPQGIFDVFHI